MGVSFQWKGDEFLKRIEEKVQKVTGQVKLTDLFTADFMRRHTKFASLDDMLTASGLASDNVQLADVIKGEEWSRFVASNSDSASWESLLKLAGNEHVQRKLTE